MNFLPKNYILAVMLCLKNCQTKLLFVYFYLSFFVTRIKMNKKKDFNAHKPKRHASNIIASCFDSYAKCGNGWFSKNVNTRKEWLYSRIDWIGVYSGSHAIRCQQLNSDTLHKIPAHIVAPKLNVNVLSKPILFRPIFRGDWLYYTFVCFVFVC